MRDVQRNGEDVMATPEITPTQLVDEVEAGDQIHMLDIRTPQQIATGRVDIVPDDRFTNIPLADFLEAPDVDLDRSARWAVVCSRGNDSQAVADALAERGFNASSLVGGVVAWMNAVVRRELETPPELDRFVQLDRIGKGALGYILVSDGEAFVVDPSRETDSIRKWVEEVHARIVGVADTHAHADYISGGPALAAACDAPYYLHTQDSFYPYDGTPGKITYEPADEGRTIKVGRATITCMHTPGHTEGSVTYVLDNHCAALTGDFIFVNSVGRPDLGGKTAEWTGVLWNSLERARREWPAELVVYPAHFSCDKERDDKSNIRDRFGRLAARNEPFAIATEAEFTEWIASRAGKFPDAYRTIKAINVGLEVVDAEAAEILEVGRNECALG